MCRFSWILFFLAAKSFAASSEECRDRLQALENRNAIIRMGSLEGYSSYLLSSPDLTRFIFVIRESRQPLTQEARAESEEVVREINRFDASIIQNDRLSFLGNSTLVDRVTLENPSPKRIALEIAEGVARLTPLVSLVGTAYYFGNSLPFWIINGAVFLLTPVVFPDHWARVTKEENRRLYQTGQVTPGIEKRLWGSRFEEYQRREIVEGLMLSIQNRINEFAGVARPVVVGVVVTPDIGDLLSLQLSRQGTYFPVNFNQVEFRFRP